MSQLLQRFTRGSPLTAEGLNRLVDAINDLRAAVPDTAENGGLQRYAAQQVLELQILDITFGGAGNPQGSFLTCVLPGQISNQDARSWFVFLPNIYVEPARPPIVYTYSNVNSRVADDTTQQETQLLTPPITIGELISVRFTQDDLGVRYYMVGDGRMWGVD